jgi:hypothetical protein
LVTRITFGEQCWSLSSSLCFVFIILFLLRTILTYPAVHTNNFAILFVHCTFSRPYIFCIGKLYVSTLLLFTFTHFLCLSWFFLFFLVVFSAFWYVKFYCIISGRLYIHYRFTPLLSSAHCKTIR